MAKIDTLTAYKCKFSYLQRNNPLLEEQRDAIKEGKQPDFTFSDFIIKYVETVKNMVIGTNTDRAIILENTDVSEGLMKGVKTWHIVPRAGKQGKPVTVIKKHTGKKYDFGSDTAALYAYHIFCYENEDGMYMIFHRQNGSGCKSVFQETANKVLKNYGLKLEMEVILPLVDGVRNASASKVTLQYTKTVKSSDAAENLKGGKKKQIIRELGINLDVIENRKVFNVIKRLQEGSIDSDTAFVTIKNSLDGADEYNDAEVRMKINGRNQTVQWGDFEKLMGVHDITKELHEATSLSHDYEGELTKLANMYFESIIELGDI